MPTTGEDKEHKIDVQLALRAYQRVREQGEQVSADAGAEAWRLDSLTVSSDFDGYTVSITDGAVTLQILFHSRIKLASPSGRALENFIARLQRAAG